jgi:PKD repeat protein
MKKLVSFLAFCLIVWSATAQYNFVTVTGFVTDIANGNPVANHPMTVQIDSTNVPGYTYYGTTTTFSDGFYVDTIFFNPTIPTGYLHVWTLDCQQQMQSAMLLFGPGNQGLNHNFQICTTASPCTADFSSQVFPNSLTVQFTDLSTGSSNLNHSWNFGDGGASNLKDPSHTYSQQGYYTVNLFIADSSIGCSSTVTKTIHVGDSTGGGCHADFYSYADSLAPMYIHFVDQSTGNNLSLYYWDFGDGNSQVITFPQSPNVVHMYAQPGTYTACLTINSNDSTCFDTKCSQITVGGSTGCQAQFTYYLDSINGGTRTVQFVDLSVGGGSSWLWNFGDSTTSTLQNPTHAFAEPGTYYVCLTITGQNPFCQSTWCMNVTVGNSTNCESYFVFSTNGLNAAFQGYMVNGLPAAYTWSFGDGASGSGQNITHSYSGPGMYYVTLTSTSVLPDSTTCTFISGQTIQVGDSTQFNQIYGQVFEGNFPLTYGTVMIFSTDSLNGYYETTTIDSMGIYSFSYVPLGSFIIWAIPGDSAGYLPTYYGDVLNWQNATVITLGQPVNPYNIHLIQAGNTVSGPGGINGHINTSSLDNSMTDKIRMMLMNDQGTAIGFYNVPASGDFDFGTLGYGVYYLRGELPKIPSDLVKVELTATQPVVNITLTFSGSHILGVNEHPSSLETLGVYPNPFRENLTVSVKATSLAPVTVTVTDLSGRIVYNRNFQLTAGNNTLKIGSETMAPGIYLLKVAGPEGTNLTRKIVKTE